MAEVPFSIEPDETPRLDHQAPLFPDLVFTGAVSLGGTCETAHWLRAWGRYGVRGPFDWLVTPLDALASILEDDAAQLGTTFALVNAGTSVRCRAYGVLYHHEFPRGEGDAVVFDAAAVVACRSKLAHKWESLVATCRRAGASGDPLLFIRTGGGTDLSWDRLGPNKPPLRAADVNAVAAAIAARFPGLSFRLLLLLSGPAPGMQIEDVPSSASLDPRVAVRVLPQGSEPPWTTEGGAWGHLLAALRFRDPPTNAVLDEALHWSGEVSTASISPDPSEHGVVTAAKPNAPDATLGAAG